jgi:hypothetical protein
MKTLTVLSPTAILGYGFPVDSFQEGLKCNPDVIAVDAGSVDPGPYYLGAGVSFTDRAAVKRDLTLILTAARERGIPVFVGSAGGAGAKPHLDWTVEIIEEIAQEKDLSFKMAVIAADIDKDVLLKRLGSTEPLGPLPTLDAERVLASPHIVAQMGWEPFARAYREGADVIVAGRAYDPAVFAALAMEKGFDPGPALHMGKILECAAIAADPGSGRDCMVGILEEQGFRLFPTNPARRCTVRSVAAHSLYEKSNPWLLPGPGGLLDLRDVVYEQLDERTVRVTGSRHVHGEGEAYRIKLEGARPVGYRTLAIAGIRDPLMIKQLNEILEQVKAAAMDNVGTLGGRLNFLAYGLNGVMGALEPVSQAAHEVGLVIDAVADSQEAANTLCSFCRSTLLHYGYPGRVSTAGNLALPYSPSDIKAGPVFEFSIHHLLTTEPEEFFKPVVYQVGRKQG